MSPTSASARCTGSSTPDDDGLNAHRHGTVMTKELESLLWYVAHTRPRCEKKLHRYCLREGYASTLPLIPSVRKYRGKSVTFQKPLFPNYVFLQIRRRECPKIRQNDYVSRLLEVPDQDHFDRQLNDILIAIETEVEVYLAPQIQAGCRVRIKRGPLQGMEGWVEKRSGLVDVLLRLDFISQAAAVKLDAEDLDPA